MIEPSSVKISAFDGNLVDKLQAVSGQAQAIKKQRQVWPLTIFYSVDFLPSRIGVMVWLDYETNDNLSTICLQFVNNLSTICLSFCLVFV